MNNKIERKVDFVFNIFNEVTRDVTIPKQKCFAKNLSSKSRYLRVRKLQF